MGEGTEVVGRYIWQHTPINFKQSCGGTDFATRLNLLNFLDFLDSLNSEIELQAEQASATTVCSFSFDPYLLS